MPGIDDVADAARGDVIVAADSDGRRDAPYRQWVRMALVGDIVAAAVGSTLAQEMSFGGDPAFVQASSGGLRVSYGVVAIACLVTWPVITALCGAYDLRTQLVGVEELRRILRAGLSLTAVLGFTVFAANALLSRGFVLTLVPLTVVLSCLWRTLVRWRTNRRQVQGTDHHRAVAVGPIDELSRLVVQVMSSPGAAIDIVAYVADDDAGRAPAGPLSLITRLPDRDAIKELPAMGVPIDLLVRAGRPLPDEMWALARRARELDAVLAVAPHREDASSHAAMTYVPMSRTPLLIVETPTLRPASRYVKAVFDRVAAVLIVLVLSPLLLAISAWLLVRQGRPVLFRQERVGRNGRPFQCLKFRTMERDAHAKVEELRARNEGSGPLFKLRDDPRVTPVGKRLRSHSLDELPQLFNVLAGSMSLVGPRPPLPNEVAEYNEREARRLLVKPGLTGLWQVEGRSDLPWDDGVYLDLLYVDHWSPLLDILIIMRTLRAVIRPTGAY